MNCPIVGASSIMFIMIAYELGLSRMYNMTSAARNSPDAQRHDMSLCIHPTPSLLLKESPACPSCLFRSKAARKSKSELNKYHIEKIAKRPKAVPKVRPFRALLSQAAFGAAELLPCGALVDVGVADTESKVCCVTVLETIVVSTTCVVLEAIVVSTTCVVLETTAVSTNRAVLVADASVVAAASAEDAEEGALSRLVGPRDVWSGDGEGLADGP